MISNELKQVILQTLNLDDWEFNDQTTASQVPGWDSLSHVNVILGVEKRFNVHFSNIEILKLRTVGDLQRLIDVKVGARS